MNAHTEHVEKALAWTQRHPGIDDFQYVSRPSNSRRYVWTTTVCNTLMASMRHLAALVEKHGS